MEPSPAVKAHCPIGIASTETISTAILFKSVLEAIESPNLENDESFKSAIDAINIVIPTRWNDSDSSGLDPFYILWGVAEEFKKSLGSGSTEKPVMYLPDKTVLDILRACGYDDVDPRLSPNPTQSSTRSIWGLRGTIFRSMKSRRCWESSVTQEEFQRGVRQVVSHAFEIAKGLLSSRLAQKTIQPIHDGEVPHEPGLAPGRSTDSSTSDDTVTRPDRPANDPANPSGSTG